MASCLIAYSCQDTYQHCLHVSKSFSLQYEPAPLTLQSLSTTHLHVNTAASKGNYSFKESHRDQPQLQVNRSQSCSFCQQGQLQSSCPNTMISSSSTFSKAPVSPKIPSMVADGETPVTLVQAQSFSVLKFGCTQFSMYI